jgi:hypothetical protein
MHLLYGYVITKAIPVLLFYNNCIHTFAGSNLLSGFHGAQLTKLSQISAWLCNGNVKMSKVKISSYLCFRMELQEKEKEPPGTHTSLPEECRRSSLNKL